MKSVKKRCHRQRFDGRNYTKTILKSSRENTCDDIPLLVKLQN